MKLRHLAPASLLALAVACGGSSGASITFTGTVRGQTEKPVGADSAFATIPTQAGNASVLAGILSNQTALCADASQTKEPKSSMYFLLFLGTLQVSGSSVSIVQPTSADVGQSFTIYAGTGVPSQRLAIVVASTTDTACHDVAQFDANGISGTVKLNTLGADGSFSADFDVTTAQQDSSGNTVAGTSDHVTGSFSAKACSGLGPLIATQRSTTCI